MIKPIKAALLLSLLHGCSSHSSNYLTYTVVDQIAHSRQAFTQGLSFSGQQLLECTGRYGESTAFRYSTESPQDVTLVARLPDSFFGEGCVEVNGQLFWLSWQENTLFVINSQTGKIIRRIHWPGEGWGLTYNGRHLIASDGSARLRFIDPISLKTVSQLTIREQGGRVEQLNELEWKAPYILANLWQQDDIVVIDSRNGEVKARISLTGLLPDALRQADTNVLNGIAVSADQDLWITGKRWPLLYKLHVDWSALQH